MINVVFLLLIFFLMTAQIAPPDPFEVILPVAERETTADAPLTLYVSAEGALAFRDSLGDDALAELAEIAQEAGIDDAPAPVQIRADTGVEGSVIAALLPRLGALGLAELTLLTTSP